MIIVHLELDVFFLYKIVSRFTNTKDQDIQDIQEPMRQWTDLNWLDISLPHTDFCPLMSGKEILKNMIRKSEIAKKTQTQTH